jgi:GNAT superfamily N-acetyltransferase
VGLSIISATVLLDQRRCCHLQDLFVSPAVRGSGIGRKLIEHVYAEAAREAARACTADP